MRPYSKSICKTLSHVLGEGRKKLLLYKRKDLNV